MQRTQIYLDEEQSRKLDERAQATGRTRSALIREAIDAYVDPARGRGAEIEDFRRAVDAAFGVAPDLPPGDEYVVAIRALDAERQRELERRG